MKQEAAPSGQLQKIFSNYHLALQPIFNLRTGRAEGAEALVRHRKETTFSAQQFVMKLEKTGLITLFDTWAIMEALRFLSNNPIYPQIAVNISATTLAQPFFPLKVQEYLKSHGVPPHQLALEVTETVPLAEGSLGHDNLTALDARGVMMIMDDFGAGHSNLLALSLAGWSAIKVDRGITRMLSTDRLRDRGISILKNVREMALEMHLDVIVEGVETEDQLRVLQGLEVSRVQGFLLGMPQPMPDCDPRGWHRRASPDLFGVEALP